MDDDIAEIRKPDDADDINAPNTLESEAPVEEEEYELEEEEEDLESIDENPEMSEEDLEDEKMDPSASDLIEEKEMISQAKHQRRSKGSITLGSGVTLFVILWLITVQQVFYANEPISEIFEVSMMMAIIAGLLFAVGMYLLVSHPKIETSK